MGKQVFANGMEIAHKAGSGKVTAAFPDVCLSPPPPPAGPVPLPYPNTSFAKDLQQGSSSVKIGGKPLALKDQSYYQTSPLGDEAATRNFGGSVLTHTITGKTYFQAYSMDVMVEGKNVCRHVDITTSNHASYPGSTPPMPNTEQMVLLAQQAIAENKCPCCNGPKHSDGQPMGRDDWYNDNINKQTLRKQRERGPNNPMSDHERKALAKDMKTRYRNLIAKAKLRSGCTCKTKTRVLPEAPCDVFYGRSPTGSPRRDAQQTNIEREWNSYRDVYQKKVGIPSVRKVQCQLRTQLGREPTFHEVRTERKVNHLTPKAAGGCPTGDRTKADNANLQAHGQLCPACRAIDDAFGEFQA